MLRHGCAPTILLALLLTLAGCQLTAGQTPSGTSSAPSQDRRLQAADARFYAGDYDGAEAAYHTLASARVTDAAAHLSTLLAVESRFSESVAEAQAGVEAHADSASLARLTRALDWAENVDGAMAAGARAISSRPVDPLAHVFYSEALADGGRFGAARRELETAEGMGGGAYVQAEIDREWANYYRGLGDTASELNYSELAARAQPGFPERQLDLVRYDYGNQRVDAARAATDSVLARHPKSYWLLVAAADAALIGGDGQRAPSLYSAAAQVRPDGAEAALGQAEMDVAVSRDFTGAHDLLLATLKKNPTSSSLYEYVRNLDLLVLHRDPATELTQIAPQPSGDLAADRQAALATLNTLRSGLALPAVQENGAMDQAAQAHAYYYLFNVGQPQLTGSAGDTEDQTLPGFVGASAVDRDRHFGYSGTRVAELVHHAFTPAASVQTSIDSVFERFPLLDRQTVSAGYGEARIGSIDIAVLDLGANAPAAGDPTAYPAADQSAVPPAFTYQEVPDPLPQNATLPAGYPVTLQLGGTQVLAVTTGQLLDAQGRTVSSYTLGPGSPLGQGQWALVPKQPLTPGARYTVDLTGKVDGKDFSKRWSFTVLAQ